MKKSFVKILTVVLSLLMVVTLAACTSQKKVKGAFDSYILAEDGSTVTKDFVLPKTISSEDGTQIEVTWTSSAPCVTLTAREEDYLASVTYPDETTVVTLTISSKKTSKSFTVTVPGITVNTFVDAYSFKNKNNTVVKDFNLDREITVQGKKATITWSVANEYKAYVEVSEDGNKAIIHQSSLNPTVKLTATFSYNGKTANRDYQFTVSMEKTALEEVDAWYYNLGSAITFDGYVVAVADPYSSQYGNVSLYVVNEDFSAGFYLYRAKCNAEDGAKLEAGAHVTVTGAQSTNYNGLREASSTGTVTIKDDQKLADVTSHIYAIDEDVLGDVPAALYHQSSLVSFSKWEVTAVTKAHADSSPTTVLKIKKGDVVVSVGYSKYMKGQYEYKADDATVAAILAKVNDITVGDYVDVYGVLGYYSGHQITLINADGIAKSEAEAEGTTHPGTTVGATVKKVQAEITEAQLEKLITSDKEVTLTTTDGDVTVAYEVMGASQDIAIEGGKFTITPTVEAKVNIKVTYTLGEYSTVDFFSIHTMAMTENEMAEYESLKFQFELLSNAGIQKGYTNKGNTFENVTVAYEGADADSQALIDMVDGNLYFLPVDTNTKITFNVKFSVGEGDDKYEVVKSGIETTIQPSKFVTYERIGAPEADKEYYFGTYSIGSGQLGMWIFADGGATSNGRFLTCTEDIAKAVKFTAIAGTNEGEYILKTGNKYMNITNPDGGANTANIKLVEDETQATPLKLQGEGATMYFAAVIDGSEFALVQNYTNKQVYIYKKDSSHFNNDNYSQYQLLTVTEDNTDTQGRADAVAEAIKVASKTAEDLSLPTTSNLYNDVVITWALKAAVEGQAVENNKLTITRGEEDVQVTLVATAKCGVKTATKEFTITVEANAKVVDIATLVTTAMEAEDGATLQGQYEVTGYVKAITGAWSDSYGNMTVVITDATGAEITLYRTTKNMTVGDVVTVAGYVEKNVYNNNTTIRFKQGHTIKSYTEATLTTPTELYNMFKDNTATDEQKATVFVVVGVVTKIVNTPGGTYTTGAYWVADSTGTVEAYKLGQADGKTETLLEIEVGSVIAFYGKATLYGTTVETTPSTLINLYKPEAVSYTATGLADVIAKVDGSETTEDLFVEATVEVFTADSATGVISAIVSNTKNKVTTYAMVSLPAGEKTTVGAKLVMKLSSAEKVTGGYKLNIKELVSSLAQSSYTLGEAKEVEFASLVPGFDKITINDVELANNIAKLSDTVNVLFYTDSTFATQLVLADDNYNFTGYAFQASESTIAFCVLSYEKAMPKAVLKSTVAENTDMAALTTAGTLTATLNLDPTQFTVVYDKNGASNECAVRTDGIRMYATKATDKGNKFTVTAAEGITIAYIKIAFDSEANGATAEIIVGDKVVTGNGGIYEINGNSFTIYNNNTNTTTNTQFRFQSITIYYTVAGE